MVHFLKKLFLFFCYVILIAIFSTICYVKYFKITIQDIPAPNFSNSYSFNEKMMFLRNCKRSADIISLGSSMVLNNLYSEAITKGFHSERYLNSGSWGMSMKDNFEFLKMIYKVYTPSTLIMASNILDFQQKDKIINYSFIEKYLRSKDHIIDFMDLRFFNVRYYITNFKYAKYVRVSSEEYEYLGFDNYGGVSLSSVNFKIGIVRWNADFINGQINSCQYSYLDSISIFCKSNKIKLIFIQSPYRSGLYSKFDTVKKNKLAAHINIVKSILKKDEHFFLDGNEVVWNDTLYDDGIHFNSVGAKLFTEFCLTRINDLDGRNGTSVSTIK